MLERQGTMIEDLSGNIKRVIDGIAVEVGRRVTASLGEQCGAAAESETRQVLLDWFLGVFYPRGP